MKLRIGALVAAMACAAMAYCADYWEIQPDARTIVWNVDRGVTHSDHLEMAGKKVAAVLRYGVDADGGFQIEKSLVWPCLRTVPNDTHASLMRRNAIDPVAMININGRRAVEQVRRIAFDGVLSVESGLSGGVAVRREYFTSTELPALVEIHTFTNTGDNEAVVELPEISYSVLTDASAGTEGAYRVRCDATGGGTHRLAPGSSCRLCCVTQAHMEGDSACRPDADAELSARRALVGELGKNLVLDTPDTVLNTMFHFSKIRACESIYETKCGPMHGPGGESYYAAVWANDQAEYANPFFPFVGYGYGSRSAENSFRLFADYMNDSWHPIPSSIIAEGTSYWNGAGDRGDAAMIAYGASRYALASGDKAKARELWPLITWCLDYCDRRIGEGGVVYSDCDELEHRFPAGEANLCTSSLYYDALLSASYLAGECGEGGKAKGFRARAAAMRGAIESYFGANVEGFDTYAYYKGNDRLRAWICIPLTMGIYDRAPQTTAALFSPSLWSGNGLLTQSGESIYWDRATLYALRGILAAGRQDEALPYLQAYSAVRLLGEHVPYAIEAWPEGNQRHLSAESALYARIFTEGLFGIRPVGLSSFTFTPQLPAEWSNMALRHIRLFGSDFDVEVTRDGADRLTARIMRDGRQLAVRKMKAGDTATIKI